MNFVFWLLVILILFAIWIILASIFRKIGNATEHIKDYVSKNLGDDNDDKRV